MFKEMTNEELEDISEPLREDGVEHLLLARVGNGISLSSLVTGEDLFDFFQVLIDTQPLVLDIMQDVLNSRREHKPTVYN